MSTLQSFSDAQLEAGINEIDKHDLAGKDAFVLRDRLWVFKALPPN